MDVVMLPVVVPDHQALGVSDAKGFKVFQRNFGHEAIRKFPFVMFAPREDDMPDRLAQPWIQLALQVEVLCDGTGRRGTQPLGMDDFASVFQYIANASPEMFSLNYFRHHAQVICPRIG